MRYIGLVHSVRRLLLAYSRALLAYSRVLLPRERRREQPIAFFFA